jgi:hypothetical protein
MSKDNDFTPFDILKALENERKEREMEAEFRYSERRMQKERIQSDIEHTAEKLHARINMMLDDPGETDAADIRNLSEALNHVAGALSAAEHYATARPMGSMLL